MTTPSIRFYTYSQVRALFEDRNLRVLSDRLGLNYHTLYRFMHNKVEPHPATWRVMCEYLEEQSDVGKRANRDRRKNAINYGDDEEEKVA